MKIKRISCILLIAAIAAGSLVGCENNNTSAPANDTLPTIAHETQTRTTVPPTTERPDTTGSYPYKDGTVNVIVKPSLVFEENDPYGFYDERTLVKKDGKYGFVDKLGDIVIPCIYTDVGDFSEGLAFVTKGGKWGCIDTDGKEVIPFIYDDGISYELIPLIYDYGIARLSTQNYFHDGLAQVIKEDSYGFIDKNGDLIIPFVPFADFMGFNDGRAWTANAQFNKVGFIDKNGDMVIDLSSHYDVLDDDGSYQQFSFFCGGFAKVGKDGKYGFIDTDGNLAVPLIYDRVESFSEGLAYAEKDGKKAFIDTSGNEVFSCDEYEYVSSFSSGLSYTEKDGKKAFIDTKGNEVFQCNEYDGISYPSYPYFMEGLAVVEKDGGYGYIDTSGSVVVPFIYDKARDFNEGLAWVKMDGEWGILEISPEA